MATVGKDDFEVVSEDSLQFSKRGRKSQVSPELVKGISTLTKGKALVIKSMTVNPNSPKAKTEKAKHSATIRQAGKQAGKKVRIGWSPAGIPQVTLA